MAAKQDATAGPCAFGIKLGMATGRGSPDHQEMEYQTVTVSLSLFVVPRPSARDSVANSCSLVGHGRLDISTKLQLRF